MLGMKTEGPDVSERNAGSPSKAVEGPRGGVSSGYFVNGKCE